jgi:hypothetical protein
MGLAGPGDGRRDQRTDNALAAQDMTHQEFGGGSGPLNRVSGAAQRVECFLRAGQLPRDGLLQQAGEVSAQ